MSTRTRKFAFTLGLVACSLTASFGAQASEASFDHNHPRRQAREEECKQDYEEAAD